MTPRRLRVDADDDTMILAYLIEPGRAEYELDDLAAEYGVELLPVPEAEEETAALVRHAAATLRLRDPLLERVRERGAEPLYREIELPLTEVLAAMEAAGVKVDTYRMGEITARLADRVEELESKAYELAGEEFMLGSTQQVARVLFETLGLTPGRKGKTGYSTDTRVLRSIRSRARDRPGDRGMAGVLEAAQHLPRAAADADLGGGRAGCTRPSTRRLPRPAGSRPRARTCRRSRSAPSSGVRSARRSSPRPGTSCSRPTTRRSSCASSRTCPAEPKLKEAFDRGEDIHTATAAEVLGKDPATLTKDERNVAKMVNFGIIYGISAFGLSENLEIPREEAQTYIDAYLARFPHVQDFIQRTIEQAARDGYVTTLFGRRRPVPEIRASNRQTRSLGERLAVNSVMQGTAADVIKKAMVAIHRRLREEGRAARLVLQVHDELLLEVPDAETSAVKELVREEMSGAFPLDPPLGVDIGTGDDWNDAKR